MSQGQLLPNEWLSLKIGDIADVVAGGTPKAGDPGNFATPGTQISWITPADLSNYSKKYISQGKRDLSQQGYESSSAKLMPAGTLLFSSRAPIGYVAIAEGDISTNQGFKNFLLPSEVSSSYAYHYFRSIRDVAENMGTGTTFKEISGSNAKKLPFILAPIAEQKVIADKLDTLLAQVDNTKARLERLPEILKRFRQSVLAAAVSGRLTEEWRNEHEVSITTWGQTTVGDVSKVATGKTPSRKETKYWQAGEVPWLTSASTGAIYTNSAEQHVTQFAVTDCSLKIFPPGTLLLAMYGEGKTRGQVTELNISATCNQACAAVTADEGKILRSYLKLRLIENYEETRKAAAGGAQPNLNLNKVRQIGIAVPSQEEQTEIVRRVDQLFTYADTIDRQVESALERINQLTQSILSKAFHGELTAQWRARNSELISGDNSAEALIEKIKIKREEETKISKRKKNGAKRRKRNVMKNSKKDELKCWVLERESAFFSFDELRDFFDGSYEELKDCLFEMLSDSPPLIKQSFSKSEGIIYLERLNK